MYETNAFEACRAGESYNNLRAEQTCEVQRVDFRGSVQETGVQHAACYEESLAAKRKTPS